LARRRFTINEHGELEDREGVVLGKVVGITLDVGRSSALTSPGSAAPAADAEPSAAAGDIGGPSLFLGGLGEDEGNGGAAGAGGNADRYDPVAEVWAHYCRVMEPRHQGLDAESRKIIRDALKVATVAECKRAIDGCRSSEFHMGKNDRARRYNSLSQILKGKRGGRTTREQVDFFIDLAQRAGLQPGVPSGRNERVRRAKRAVLDAAEFPGDERVAEHGRQAEAWLVEQGWRIEKDEGQMPRFFGPDDAA
jgi:hypothetical protein